MCLESGGVGSLRGRARGEGGLEGLAMRHFGYVMGLFHTLVQLLSVRRWRRCLECCFAWMA